MIDRYPILFILTIVLFFFTFTGVLNHFYDNFWSQLALTFISIANFFILFFSVGEILVNATKKIAHSKMLASLGFVVTGYAVFIVTEISLLIGKFLGWLITDSTKALSYGFVIYIDNQINQKFVIQYNDSTRFSGFIMDNIYTVLASSFLHNTIDFFVETFNAIMSIFPSAILFFARLLDSSLNQWESLAIYVGAKYSFFLAIVWWWEKEKLLTIYKSRYSHESAISNSIQDKPFTASLSGGVECQIFQKNKHVKAIEAANKHYRVKILQEYFSIRIASTFFEKRQPDLVVIATKTKAFWSLLDKYSKFKVYGSGYAQSDSNKIYVEESEPRIVENQSVNGIRCDFNLLPFNERLKDLKDGYFGFNIDQFVDKKKEYDAEFIYVTIFPYVKEGIYDMRPLKIEIQLI